jgi:hypothetical protein
MKELPEFIKLYMASFSDEEKSDFLEADEEMDAFAQFLSQKKKDSKNDLTGTNELEQ